MPGQAEEEKDGGYMAFFEFLDVVSLSQMDLCTHRRTQYSLRSSVTNLRSQGDDVAQWVKVLAAMHDDHVIEGHD